MNQSENIYKYMESSFNKLNTDILEIKSELKKINSVIEVINSKEFDKIFPPVQPGGEATGVQDLK